MGRTAAGQVTQVAVDRAAALGKGEIRRLLEVEQELKAVKANLWREDRLRDFHDRKVQAGLLIDKEEMFTILHEMGYPDAFANHQAEG